MANVLTVVAKIRAAKGKGDALATLLAEQAGVVRKAEPGCLVYRPHRSSKDPDLFLFYEMYKDDAAFDVHRKAPHLAAYRERREKEGLTEGPAEVEIYRSLTRRRGPARARRAGRGVRPSRIPFFRLSVLTVRRPA
jgi:quinol monooxygenase YgiN